MVNSSMQELLEYIKTCRAVVFLPSQLANTIEEKYLAKSMNEIKTAFNDGEMNVWNRDRDGNIFEYEGGEYYCSKNYKPI